MSKIYADNNIHEALEKVAGLPGYMKKQISKAGLKKLRAGKDALFVDDTTRKFLQAGKAHSARLNAYTEGRATAKSIAKARKSSGQERRIHLGDAASTRKSGEWRKRQFRELVPKVKVASDDNVHTALEKVAVNKRLMGKSLPRALGTAVGGGLMGLGLVTAYKALSGKRSKYHEPDPAKMDARIEAIARKTYESQYKK